MAGEDRIKYLADAVRYHRELYYNHSAPEITDAEFDALWDELKQLDPNNAVLHEVGPEPLPGTVKVEHMFPMRSLDKGTSDEDIIHFVTQSTFGGKRYLAQPKLDGSALSLEYEEIDESQSLDPLSKEWEGNLSWGEEQITVAESLKKIDLASLIDWEEN